MNENDREKDLKTSINILLLMILFLIGALCGAYYADYNNKIDILNVANNETQYLAFNLDGVTHYFTIEEINPYNFNYINVSLLNETEIINK